ncbi:GNAT family N-acetyltransferase [Streptococcaceae bacterium ESL0687]|nr:GNAT family N-acetyltransferase [Streptococcaceae bacterium ESL0687]
MDNKLVIRQVVASDLENVMRVEEANFGHEATSKRAMKERIQTTADTFLVAEIAGNFAGYIEGAVISDKYLSDELFEHVEKNPETGGYLAITSLSIDDDFQGQGLGDALLLAFKDLATKTGREAITLTCHDYLIKYYEKKGFTYEGKSTSTLGGGEWFNMIWEVE